MAHSINYLLFDLGGVLINIDPPRTLHRFRDLGLPVADGEFANVSQSERFNALEIGALDPQDFLEGLQQLSTKPVTIEQLLEGWNELILDFPAPRIPLLQTLKAQMPTFLLSNTNELHLDFINKHRLQPQGINGLDELFHRSYYSCRMGSRKPDRIIFEQFLEAESVPAEEVLFLDDTVANLDTASTMGFQTALCPADTDVQGLLEKHGILVS